MGLLRLVYKRLKGVGGCLLLHITNKIGMLFAPSRPLRSVKKFNFCHSSLSFSLLVFLFLFRFYLHIHTLHCIFIPFTKIVIIVKLLTFLCNKFAFICKLWLIYALFCILSQWEVMYNTLIYNHLQAKKDCVKVVILFVIFK